jgi:hypothetical protein
MRLGVDFNILNQKGTPAFYSDTFINRPTYGFNGRVFISTDTGAIYEDTGSAWVLIADAGGGSTGTLQQVTTNGYTTNVGISISAGGLATNTAQITSLNQTGGVLFTDGSGNLQQDTNFNWDNTNNYLGIGQTGTPTAPLDIHNGTLGVFMQLNATSTNNSTIAFQNASVGKWRVGNLYSAGSNLFHIYNNTTSSNSLTISAANAATFIGSLTASSLIKSGGTSSQFLKADGSVDSSSYITFSSLSATTPLSYNNTTGAFTILQSSTSQSGYLSSTDWNTFNNKASLTAFSASSPLSYNNSTGAFSIQVANSGQNGYLTSTDWNTFNNKQSTLTLGNLTETVSSVLTIAGGTNAVVGTGTTIQIKQASASQSGYLSSTDWNTFNNKQSTITNPITGTGTSGYVPKFNGTTTLTNSIIQDSGTVVGIKVSTLGAWDTTLVPLEIGAAGNFYAGFNGASAIYLGSGAFYSGGWKYAATGTGVNLLDIGNGNFNVKYAGSGTINNAITWNTGLIVNNAGNVGIGTSSPTNITGYGGLTINGTNGAYTYWNINGTDTGRIITDSTNFYFDNVSTGATIFRTTASSTNRICLTNSGQVLLNGSTSSNGQGVLQNTGQTFTGGLGIGGLTFSTNTNATVNTSFYFFNGGAGVSLTLPDTNGQSMIYYIKNYSASPLTIARTGSNTFIAAGTITTVTSLTLATGVSTTIIGNGTTNYIQIQ